VAAYLPPHFLNNKIKMKALKIYDNNEVMGKYNLVSASLYNYLPNICTKKHEDIFKKILSNQRDSIANQESFNALDKTTIVGLNPINGSYKIQQSIICTFHLGSYRLINLFLIKNNVEYTLVVSKKLLQMQGDNFIDFFKKQNGFYEGRYNVLDADSPSSTINMIRHLKKGKSLLIYTDGNLGSGMDIKESRNSCLLNFLNQKIYARTGAGYLSHLLNIPILPVYSYKNEKSQDILKFDEKLFPNQSISRSSYSFFITSLIYKNVEEFIRKYPEQWEGWLYLHKIAVINNSVVNANMQEDEHIDKSNLFFNDDEFGLFKIGDNYYLFEKKGYNSYNINEDLYKLLLDNIKSKKNILGLNQNTLKSLIGRRVII
jgi:lauroyl/myristoyl acyltransferase